MYNLQHGALAHIEHQPIKGPKILKKSKKKIIHTAFKICGCTTIYFHRNEPEMLQHLNVSN